MEDVLKITTLVTRGEWLAAEARFGIDASPFKNGIVGGWREFLKMMLVYGSVCSGVGAAAVAWGPLGWKPAFFAEILPFPSAVLKHRYPNVPNLGDMTKIYD